MNTKLYPELQCPHCGSKHIHIEDIYDLEGAYIEGENALVEMCVGVCRDCGKSLQWEQTYKFIGFRNIIINEDGAE